MKKIKLYIMKNILFFFMLAGIATNMSAQQINSYQMFHLNNYLQSPACAGTKPYIFLSTAYSQSWSGFKGAPSMQSATGHSLVSERVGVGGKISYDNSGLSGQFGAEATYAYHLPVGKKGTRLSFGLSGLLSQYSLKKDAFIVADIDDEVINNAENSIIVPDAAFGVALYRPDKFYLNYGIYQLLGRSVSFLNNSEIENKRVRHHILNAGYQFLIGKTVKIEPSVLFKMTKKGFYQADAGIKSTFHDVLSLGVFYRTDEAVVTFIGIDTKYLVYGYSYGIVLSDVKKYTVGSHEIMLILKLNNAKSNLK
jgi:type IX secretion system PorP/SprF family membrane protein